MYNKTCINKQITNFKLVMFTPNYAFIVNQMRYALKTNKKMKPFSWQFI